jgi:hypothetical protein
MSLNSCKVGGWNSKRGIAEPAGHLADVLFAFFIGHPRENAGKPEWMFTWLDLEYDS